MIRPACPYAVALSGRKPATSIDRRRALGAGLVLALAVASPAVVAARAPRAVAWPPLRLIDGTEVDASHWSDRSVVVVFWATWCAYCKRHNDRLSRLYAARGESEPRVLAVAIDGDLASVTRHVSALGWTFPVTLDGGRLRALFTDRKSVPLTVFVDADGLVRQRIPGEMTEDDLRQLMRG